MMIEIGRTAVKLAGRDAGKKCVIVDILDNNFVLIDGAVRRRKCNIKHLEFLAETVKINKSASHSEACKALGIEVAEKKSKTAAAKPKQVRKVKTPKVEAKKKSKPKESKKEATAEK